MTQQDIQKLKEKLPPKAYRNIAERTGYSYETVRSVFRGIRNNEKIIDAAIELAIEYNKTEKKRSQKISSL